MATTKKPRREGGGRLGIVRQLQRSGISRAEALAKVDTAVRDAADRGGWSPVETALSLADWHRQIDAVYGSPVVDAAPALLAFAEECAGLIVTEDRVREIRDKARGLVRLARGEA